MTAWSASVNAVFGLPSAVAASPIRRENLSSLPCAAEICSSISAQAGREAKPSLSVSPLSLPCNSPMRASRASNPAANFRDGSTGASSTDFAAAFHSIGGPARAAARPWRGGPLARSVAPTASRAAPSSRLRRAAARDDHHCAIGDLRLNGDLADALDCDRRRGQVIAGVVT